MNRGPLRNPRLHHTEEVLGREDLYRRVDGESGARRVRAGGGLRPDGSFREPHVLRLGTHPGITLDPQQTTVSGVAHCHHVAGVGGGLGEQGSNEGHRGQHRAVLPRPLQIGADECGGRLGSSGIHPVTRAASPRLQDDAADECLRNALAGDESLVGASDGGRDLPRIHRGQGARGRPATAPDFIRTLYVGQAAIARLSAPYLKAHGRSPDSFVGERPETRAV